jgi:hypothetical protein
MTPILMRSQGLIASQFWQWAGKMVHMGGDAGGEK